MNKVIKKKWLAALTSGKYKKARGKLKGQNGYCCLGVLCDISGKGTFKANLALEGPNPLWFFHYKKADPDHGGLPVGLRQALGISYDDHEKLVSINDRNGGWSKVIDYIKRKL